MAQTPGLTDYPPRLCLVRVNVPFSPLTWRQRLPAGALAAQPRYYGGPGYYADDAVGYCMSRFKSYDPASGTYLGYDGYRHPCR